MTMRPFTDNRGGLNHLVDAQIGRAFPVVHKVYQHLDAIEYVAQVYESGRSRDIVIRTNHTKEWVEWQYKGEAQWTILFKFSDLLGADIADVVAAEQAIATELEQLRQQIVVDAENVIAARDAADAAHTGAEAARTAAESARDGAQASETAAAQSALTAGQYAQNLEDAKTAAQLSANQAAADRLLAEQAANTTGIHAATAETAITTVVEARQATEGFAAEANTAKSETALLQAAAEQSAQAAEQSQIAASGSANEAAVSATAAALSADTAANHLADVSDAKVATETAAAAGAQHLTTIESQVIAAGLLKDQTEAASQAGLAAQTAAETAATNAATSAGNAEAAAIAAEQSAQTAGQSEAVALGAAANASTAASAAEVSAQVAADHRAATEAAVATSTQHLADVEAQVVSVEALKQETVDARQATLAAKADAESAAVSAATFAENADVSAAESATSANAAEASANAANTSAHEAAAHKTEAKNQAVAAEASALASANSATASAEKLGEVAALHDVVVAASTSATEAANTSTTQLTQVTALHGATEAFAQAAQTSAEQADTAATSAGVSASDALQLRNETQGFHDAASAMVVDAAQVSADRATVQSLAQEVQLAADQAQSNALAAASSADTAVASANAAADSATTAETNASTVLGQVTAISGRLDEAVSIVATVTTLRDETRSYQQAAQDSTTNAQSVAADRAAVAGMMGTIAADAASAADSKDQALAAAATAAQADVAANTALTVAQNAAQEVADNILAAQDAAAAALDSQTAAASAAAAALDNNNQSADNAAQAAATAAQVVLTAGQVAINAQQVADDVVAVATAKNEVVDSRDRAETAAVNAEASASVANAAKASATDSATQAAVSFAGVAPLHTEVVSKHADVLVSAAQVAKDLLATDAAKGAAETAQADAETAEALARDWATKMDGPVLNDGVDKFSAQYWAAQAEQVAADATAANTGALAAVANHTAAADPHTQYLTKAESTDALATKVDKEVGKGLSTEDFTTEEKSKLASVENGANAYNHPDNHPASIITQDTNNRFVSDAEKTAWNAKQAPLINGVNIKTINGESLLGGGDLVVSGSSNGGQDMPIGGITWMHPEFVPDEFTDNEQRFVRTGTAVAFEPGGKHDAALDAGFGLYDSVKKVGYAGAITLESITCVDNVSGSLTFVKDKVVFTPWFNSSGIGLMEFPPHPVVATSLQSYCWSPVLQTWLVGYVKPIAEGKRELCVDHLLRGKWVETYRIDSGVAANNNYGPYSFACSSQDTAIFEFTLGVNVRYELAIALDAIGTVIGKVLKNEPSILSSYRRWFAGKDGYVIADRTSANPSVSTFFRSPAETVRQDVVTYKTTLQSSSIFSPSKGSSMRAVYHEGAWVLLYGNSTYPNYANTVATSTTGLMGSFSERKSLSGSYPDINLLGFTVSGWVGHNQDSQSSTRFITSPDGVAWNTKNRVSTGNTTLLSPLFKDSFVTTEGVYPYSGDGIARTSTSFAFQGMAANDHGRVFAFSNGIIGFIPHDRHYHLMDLVYTYNTAASSTTLCKTVNGQFFVYMTSVGLLTSANGVDWTVLATGLPGPLYDVEYLSGTYVVVGSYSGGKNFSYSTDLNSWTTGYIRTTSTNVMRLLNTGERLVALSSSGTAYSETGIEWVQGTSGNFSYTLRAGLVHDGVIDVFMYNGNFSVVQWRSVDGGATFTNVKTVTLPTGGNSFLDMCIRKGKWWALRGELVYSSSDGNTWSPEPLMGMPISNPYPQLIEVGGELRFMTGHDTWLVLDSDSNVPALVGTKLEVVQESGAVGFIRIE